MYNNDTAYVSNGLTFNRFLAKSFGVMALGIFLTAVIALVSFPLLIQIIVRFGMIGILLIYGAQLGLTFFFGSRLMTMKKATAYLCFFIYCAISGLTFSTIPLYYDGGTIALALFMTAVMFGCMAFIGLTTKMDFTKMTPYLSAGLMAIIILTLVNQLFIHSSMTALMIDYAVIIIFLVMIAHDMQMLRSIYNEISYDDTLTTKVAVYGAFSIYLDFINIFIRILSILGRSNNDN